MVGKEKRMAVYDSFDQRVWESVTCEYGRAINIRKIARKKNSLKEYFLMVCR